MKVSISKVQTPVGIILKKTKFSSSKQLVNPKRQLKKEKKGQNVLAFLYAYYYPKTHLIKAVNSLDSSIPNERL